MSFAGIVDPFLDRADVVKVSTDDLRLFAPGQQPRVTGRGLLDRNPVAVLITDGPGPVAVLTAEGSDEVAVPRVNVVDTVGAGAGLPEGFRWGE